MSSTVGDVSAPRSRARRVGGLAAGLLVLLFLAAAVIGGWDSIESYDWQLEAPFLAVAVTAAVASLALNGLGYVLLVERVGGRPVPRRRLLSIWSQSVLARYVPGNVMMVAARVVLGREAGVSGRASLAASVYEQVLTLGVGAVGAVALLAGGGDPGDPWLWAVAFVPAGLVLLHPRVFERVSTAVFRRIGRAPLDYFLSMRQVVLFAGLYAAATGLMAVAAWATVRSLAGPEAGGVLLVGSAFLLSYVVSMIAFVFPSGIGVREGVLALVLARNLPGGVAVAAATATRLVLTFVEIAFTAAVVAYDRRRRDRLR